MNLARHAYQVFKTDGPHAVAAAARDRIRSEIKWYSPKISWARLGPASTLLAKLAEPQRPPVLVLSVPRTGSSWVGETLGCAQDALYLREPMTQSCLAYFRQTGHPQEIVYDPESSAASEVFASAADRAFSGLPVFPRWVVTYPGQWDPRSRKKRRLVIKEVNPMACKLLVEQYQPRVILLVRHPAAVSVSYANMKWISRPLGRQQGENLGETFRTALDSLAGYAKYTVVTYEELCAAPVSVFQRLYKFSALKWDDSSKAYIQRRTSGEDPVGRHHRYGTSRDSRSMIRAWVSQLSTEELEELRAGYSSFDLPWYQADEDWS